MLIIIFLMFPFNYNKTFEIEFDLDHQPDLKHLIDVLSAKFDNPKIFCEDTIQFENFNSIIKRHRWLDNGELKLIVKESKIEAELTLNFYAAPTMILFLTCAIFAINLRGDRNEGFGFLTSIVFCAFYGL